MAELPMTTNQIEHLRLIDAHLERLLAIAEKRTPGGWHFEPGGGHACNRIVAAESVQTSGWPERINGVSNASYTNRVCENLGDPSLPYPAANIVFIASCAGNAEAGWKATRAAIKHILSGGHGYDNGEDLLVESILAAFPLEILKHNDNP